MAKAGTKSAKNLDEDKTDSMVGKVKSDFPKHTLEDTLRVCIGLTNSNAGKPLPPIETAEAIGMSPGSSDFRVILSSSLKYGLTSGSYKSDRVSVEHLGQRVAEPTSGDDRQSALIEAALMPETFKAMYQYFKGKKLPEQAFFENTVVREFSVPREHASRCVEIFKKNVEFVGLVKEIANSKWLSTDGPVASFNVRTESEEQPPTDAAALAPSGQTTALTPTPARAASNKVFIAHGKNDEILPQLKDLLTFGGFEPVVSKENESRAEPVPQKIISEMRSCSAAVINVAKERQLTDTDGNSHHVLNENVLIEIGAALALYGMNFILLVEKGVHLPSDMQGLYRCDYAGGKLDYEATMKLLKTFSLFRKN